MARIERDYGLAQAIQFILKNEDSVTTTETINNGEDFGKIKYNLVEGGQYPYIELQLEHMAFWEWWGEKSYNLTPLLTKIYFDDVEREEIENGCFYINLPRANVISDGVPPLIQTNINENYHKLFGFVYADSDGETHLIDITHQRVQRGYWQKAVAGRVDQMNDSFYSALGSLSFLESSGKIASNFPLAESLGGALKYLKTGDESDLLNGGHEPVIAERNINTLYLKSTVYRSATSSRTQAVKVESHRWEFDVQRYNDDGTEIEKWNRGVIGFVNDTNTGHYNLGFMENTSTKNLVKIRVDGVEVPKNSFSWVTGLTTYTENTKDVIEDQTYFYWSDISTNMYIFDTLYNAQQVIQGIEEGIVKMFEGDDLTNTHLNDNDLDFNTDMSDCFVLNQTDVKELAKRFNAYVTDSGDIVSDLFVGMAMHENPIDCNIDLFEMPIDVSEFCETEQYLVKFSPSVTPPTPETGGHAIE